MVVNVVIGGVVGKAGVLGVATRAQAVSTSVMASIEIVIVSRRIVFFFILAS